MQLKELDAQLQSDLSDDETINQAHNAYARYKYLSRSIRSINEILKSAQKENYIILEKYVGRYTLPTDFLKCIRVSDLYNQYIMNPFKLGNEIRKQIGRPLRYEILESGPQRRIVFDTMIDTDPVQVYVGKAYSPGDTYVDIYSEDFTNWFDGTVVRVDDNSQYMQISQVVDQSELTGPSTISTVGTALTLDSGTFGGLLAEGDSITADGQTIVITAVDDLSTEAYTIVSEVFSVKRLYIEENTLTSVTDTAMAVADTITLVDLIMDYNYEIGEYYADGLGTLTTVGAACTTSVSHGLKTGDSIFVLTNDPNMGEIREITVTGAATFTITALSANVTAVSYIVLYSSDIPPLPLNFSEYITDGAMINAFKKETRLEEAMRMDAIWRQKLNGLSQDEFNELLSSTVPGVNEMEMIGQDWEEDIIV